MKFEKLLEDVKDVPNNKGAFKKGIGPHQKADKFKKDDKKWYHGEPEDPPSNYGEKGEGFS